jgi:hypothetical protein
MSLRKIVVGVGIVAVLGYFLLGDKVKKIIEQFQNVKVVPVAFKSLNTKWNDGVPYVTFKLDLKMVNPTPLNFNASIVAVKLKRILFYNKNNILFGSSEMDINAISIPANSSITIKDIPVAFDLKTALTTAMEMILGKEFNTNDIRTEVVIEILGIDYKLS